MASCLSCTAYPIEAQQKPDGLGDDVEFALCASIRDSVGSDVQFWDSRCPQPPRREVEHAPRALRTDRACPMPSIRELASKSPSDRIIRKQRKAQKQASLMLLRFLDANGFNAQVNARRTRYLGLSFTYPLHEAAKQNETYIVRLLLRFQADPRNSALPLDF